MTRIEGGLLDPDTTLMHARMTAEHITALKGTMADVALEGKRVVVGVEMALHVLSPLEAFATIGALVGSIRVSGIAG